MHSFVFLKYVPSSFFVDQFPGGLTAVAWLNSGRPPRCAL